MTEYLVTWTLEASAIIDTDELESDDYPDNTDVFEWAESNAGEVPFSNVPTIRVEVIQTREDTE